MAGHHYPKRPRLEASYYTDPECVFHVVIRAFVDTKPFEGSLGQIVWDGLLHEAGKDDVAIVAACLMPDHLHAVLRPGSMAVPLWVRLFKGYRTKELQAQGYVRPVWQPGFWDHLVRSESEYSTLIQYIRENPIRVGLASSFEDWPWLLMPET